MIRDIVPSHCRVSCPQCGAGFGGMSHLPPPPPPPDRPDLAALGYPSRPNPSPGVYQCDTCGIAAVPLYVPSLRDPSDTIDLARGRPGRSRGRKAKGS